MLRFSRLAALSGLFFLGAAPLLPRAGATPALNARFASGQRPQTTRVFRSLGLLGNKTSWVRTRILPPALPVSQRGAPISRVSPASSSRTSAAVVPLSFQFSGYTSAQTQTLSNFVRDNYDRMVAIFGQPSGEQGGKTITVVGNDAVGAAYQPLLQPNAKDGGTIYFNYSSGDSAQINTLNFSRLVLLSFQGPNVFSYDFKNGRYVESWLYGFADAAALQVVYGAAGSPANFDPSQLGAYVLPVYDLFNHSELGNAFIYSPSGRDLVISDFRAAMAQAAWLKVAIEKPQFFALFNAAYYSRFPARTAASPNALRALAAEIVPTVEGLGFQDWARRQYALDTSVTTGQKLFAAALPLPVLSAGDQRSGFNGFAEAFTTDASGDEIPSTGYGSVSAFDEKNQDINALSSELRNSNLLDFTANKGDFPGQASFGAGFSSLGTPDQARVTLKLRFGAAETTAVFPYIAGGGKASDITYYGVTRGGESGSLALSSSNGVAETATLSRGAFAGAKRYVSGARVVTNLTLGGRLFVRNTAWLSAGATARGIGFALDGSPNSTTATLQAASGASALRMISVPIFPFESDEAKILGVDAATLKLARYRPNLAPGTINNGVLSFGIGGDRHEIYPNISAPMTPGRGYWLGVAGDFQAQIKGSAPSSTVPYEVPITGGWNQIGVPFNRAVSIAALKVRFGGFSPVSYAQAVSNGWVSAGIWKWQPRGGYARIDGTVTEPLQPFEGYYIFSAPARGVSLVFDATTPAARTAQAQNSGWMVPLIASTSVSRDASNRFGVSRASAAAKPPTAAPVVTLRFSSSGSPLADATGAGAATGWADSFLPVLSREAAWKFVVEGTRKGEIVALSWGDLSVVPADLKIALLDEKNKKQLRIAPRGSFRWTSQGVPRAFELRATRRATAKIAVTQTGSRGVDIAVTLNMAAAGRLDLFDVQGNTILTLKSGVFEAGTQRFPWSGQKSNGSLARPGKYRVQWTPQQSDDQYGFAAFSWR